MPKRSRNEIENMLTIQLKADHQNSAFCHKTTGADFDKNIHEQAYNDLDKCMIKQ
jgi:hypothetical protein